MQKSESWREAEAARQTAIAALKEAVWTLAAVTEAAQALEAEGRNERAGWFWTASSVLEGVQPALEHALEVATEGPPWN